MKKELAKIGEKNLEKSGSDLLDLSVIFGMQHGQKAGSVISKKTESGRFLAGRQFLQWAKENGITGQNIIGSEVINKFLNSFNWKPNTKNIKREHIIQIIKAQSDSMQFKFWVLEQAKQIKKESVPVGIKDDQYLTIDQVKTLIESTRKEKNKLILEFLFQTGCRIDEIITLTVKDVKLNGEAKIFVMGKGSKGRVVYCKRELFERIQKEFNCCDKNDLVFTTTARNGNGEKVQYNRVNLFRIVELAGKKAGLSIHPHTFRHSCAMHLKAVGKSVQYVQKYLGHSDPATTIKYYFHDEPGSEVTKCF